MKPMQTLLLVFVICFGRPKTTIALSKFPGYTFLFDPVTGAKVDAKPGSGVTIEECMKSLTEFTDPERDAIDVNIFFPKYAECVTKQLDNSLSIKTVALYGELIEENAKYDGYKLFFEFGGIKYDTEDQEPQDATVILVKWLHNEQNSYIYSLVEEEFTSTSTTAVTSTKGLTTSASATVGFEASSPFVSASASVTVSGSAALDKENTKTVSNTHTYALAENITVYPKSSVQIIWTQNESRRKAFWNAHVKITGWIMIRFHSAYKGSDTWVIPIGDLGYYCPEFFERLDPLEMNYYAKGVIEDTKSIQSVVTAAKFPLRDPSCKD